MLGLGAAQYEAEGASAAVLLILLAANGMHQVMDCCHRGYAGCCATAVATAEGYLLNQPGHWLALLECNGVWLLKDGARLEPVADVAVFVCLFTEQSEQHWAIPLRQGQLGCMVWRGPQLFGKTDWSNRTEVLAAVRQDGDALWDASEELKKDPEIVLAAMQQYGYALGHASEELKKDPKFMLAAVLQNGYALGHASEELQKDLEIVLAAVLQNGNALQFASKELTKDPEIVLAAVLQNGNALGRASEELQKDPEIVLAAVLQDGRALAHASEELKKVSAIVLAAVQQNGEALLCGSEELTKDPKFVLAAVQRNGLALRHASKELAKDPEIVLAAVLQNGNALGYASEELKKDPEIVLLAVLQNGDALQHASEELQKDREIVLARDGALPSRSTLNHDYKAILEVAIKYNVVEATRRLVAWDDTLLSHNTVLGNGRKPLHYAAELGKTELCMVLVRAGVARCKDKEGRYPYHVARNKGHDEAADYLENTRNVFGQGAGRGNALDQALADQRAVIQVLWYGYPLGGGAASKLGAYHSIIRIVLEGSTSESSEHAILLTECPFLVLPTACYMIVLCRIGDGYVIEKVDRQKNHKKGVMVSFWKDVRNAIPQGREEPKYRLECPEDFKACYRRQSSTAAAGEGSTDEPAIDAITMAQLYEIAVGDGQKEYDVGDANCHHMAYAVFNHCASDRKRVEQIPNSFLTGMPRYYSYSAIC